MYKICVFTTFLACILINRSISLRNKISKKFINSNIKRRLDNDSDNTISNINSIEIESSDDSHDNLTDLNNNSLEIESSDDSLTDFNNNSLEIESSNDSVKNNNSYETESSNDSVNNNTLDNENNNDSFGIESNSVSLEGISSINESLGIGNSESLSTESISEDNDSITDILNHIPDINTESDIESETEAGSVTFNRIKKIRKKKFNYITRDIYNRRRNRGN